MTMRAPAWLKSTASGLGRGFRRARTLGLAAEMSFWLFLALVPLSAVAGLVAARVAMTHSQILASVLESVPPSVRTLVTQQVENVAAWNGGRVAPVAAVTFLWLGASGVHAVFDALEVQSGTSRPWWKKRLLALAACVALSIGVALLALLGAGLESVQAVAGRGLPPALLRAGHGPLAHGLRLTVAALIAVAMTSGLYRVGVPRSAGVRFAILPGAMVAVALQAALGWAYGVYITKMGGGDAYLAGLATVGVTLMTLWLFSVALLLGVQLNQVIGEKRGGREHHTESRMAERLPRAGKWPISVESSSQPTSPRLPIEPSTGPSTSPRTSERPSR
jgi:membrane protein